MSDFIKKGDKIFGAITKYSSLVGGFTSLINAIFYSETDGERLAWICSALFAFSGFAQVVKLSIKEDENDIPG